MGLCKKALNFDLDTNQLKIYYPGKHWRQAYRDIKKYLLNNGFKHRQGSGYVSIDPMAQSKVEYIVRNLSVQYDWMKHCVKEFDVTDVGNRYSLIGTFGILGSKEKDEPVLAVKKVERVFLDEQISSAEKAKDELQRSDVKSLNIEKMR